MENSCHRYKIEQMRPEDAAEAAAIEARIFSMPWSENGFRTSIVSSDTLYLCVRDGENMIAYCGLLQSFDEADITNIGRILDFLEDDDDVQEVYHNWEE